ncbi:MAG: PDGLE domain-containing protein [Syntrophomonas sp.]
MFKSYKNLWLGLGILMLLSPLGLLATGTAFGEWGVDQLPEEAGFVPAGLAKLADFWQYSLMPDYGIAGFDASFMQSAVGYILSAVVGVFLIVLIMNAFSKVLKD